MLLGDGGNDDQTVIRIGTPDVETVLIPAPNEDAWVLDMITLDSATGDVVIYRNSKTATNTVAIGYTTKILNAARIGGNAPGTGGGTDRFDGDIAAVIVFSGVLQADREAVFDYLNIAFNLGL